MISLIKEELVESNLTMNSLLTICMKDIFTLMSSLPAANVQSIVSFPLLISHYCLKGEYRERLLQADILFSSNDDLQLRVKN